MKKIDATLTDINSVIFNTIKRNYPIFRDGQVDSSSIEIKYYLSDYETRITIKGYLYYDRTKKSLVDIVASKKYKPEELKEVVDYIIRYNEFAPYNSFDKVEVNNSNYYNILSIYKNHWGNNTNNTSFDGEAIVECYFDMFDKNARNVYLKEIINDRGSFYSNAIGDLGTFIRSDKLKNLKEDTFRNMDHQQMLNYINSLSEEELFDVLMNMSNENFFSNYFAKEENNSKRLIKKLNNINN